MHQWQAPRHVSFNKSDLIRRMQRTLVTPSQTYCIYGDPAYVLRPVLQIGFKGSRLTESEKDFDAAMSSVHVTVECGCANATNLWSFLGMRRALRRGLFPVRLHFLVGLLLCRKTERDQRSLPNCADGSP
jgi:hypothetical protein